MTERLGYEKHAPQAITVAAHVNRRSRRNSKGDLWQPELGTPRAAVGVILRAGSPALLFEGQ
jgi:hypothetical protein